MVPLVHILWTLTNKNETFGFLHNTVSKIFFIFIHSYEIKEGGTTSVSTFYPCKILKKCYELLTHLIRALINSHYPNYRPLFDLDGSLPGFLYTYIFQLLMVRGIVTVTRIPHAITSTLPTVLDEVVFFGYHLIQTNSHYPNYRPLFELDGVLPGFLNTYTF